MSSFSEIRRLLGKLLWKTALRAFRFAYLPFAARRELAPTDLPQAHC